MRITFDANILVYSLNAGAGAKHGQAIDLLRRGRRGNCVLTLQALGEMYWVAIRKGHAPRDRVERSIAGMRRLFPVRAADEGAFDEALGAARDHAVPFWDALLWATARRSDCSLLLTEDFQDGRRLGGVTFLNPFNPDNRELLDVALPATD